MLLNNEKVEGLRVNFKGINSFQLKWLAIAFMVVDHVNSYFGSQLGFPSWVAWLGRFVAPLFVFLLVEGFRHTRSRAKYAKRLGLAAFVTAIGNVVYQLLTGAYINPLTHQPDYFLFLGPHNIFLTLFLLFCMMWVLATMKQSSVGQKIMLILTFLILLVLTAASEGGIYLIPMMLLMFVFKEEGQRNKLLIGIFVYTMILLALAISSYMQTPVNQSLYDYLTFDNEFMMVTVIPLIALYNGQLGGTNSKWNKYFFYLFYPIHLWIIYVSFYFVR